MLKFSQWFVLAICTATSAFAADADSHASETAHKSRADFAIAEHASPAPRSGAFEIIGLNALRHNDRFKHINGKGVTVAVIDSGVDFEHHLLGPNFLDTYDIAGDRAIFKPTSGHGTHVAGLIGATDPRIGVAPGVKLIGLQVFVDRNGKNRVPDRNIKLALQWVLKNHLRYNILVVNMSLGGGTYTSPQWANDAYRQEIQDLERQGVTIVSAAGNGYYKKQSPNSGVPGILSTLNVGAVWQGNEGGPFTWHDCTDFSTAPDRFLSFSQRPPKEYGNAIFAPGAILRSTWLDDTMRHSLGTSIAAPIVSGSVALMQQAALEYGGRFLRPREVRDILMDSADTIVDGDDEDDSVRNTGEAYPRLNTYRAIERVRDMFGAGKMTSRSGWRYRNDSLETAHQGPVLAPHVAGKSHVVRGSIGFDPGGIRVGNTDFDLYRFEVAAKGTVRLRVEQPKGLPEDGFSSTLRVFDAQGRELAKDQHMGAARLSQLVLDLKPGVYYAGISGRGNDTYSPRKNDSGAAGRAGQYQLRLEMLGAQPQPAPEINLIVKAESNEPVGP